MEVGVGGVRVAGVGQHGVKQLCCEALVGEHLRWVIML